MKNYILLFFIIGFFGMVCYGENPSNHMPRDVFAYLNSINYNYNDETIHATGLQQDSLMIDLVDIYNGAVTMDVIYPYLHEYLRLNEREILSKPLSTMDCAIIHDSTIRAMSNTLKKLTLNYLLDYKMHNEAYRYFAHYTTQYYERYISYFQPIMQKDSSNTTLYSQFEPIHENLKKYRMLSDSLYQKQLLTLLQTEKDFNHRCIYTLEYAHSSKDGSYFKEAIPYLIAIMSTNEYSPFIYDIWSTWFVMHVAQIDSYQDKILNKFRKQCAENVLVYLSQHPKDVSAVNQFLLIAYAGRNGTKIGICKYELFPEYYVPVFTFTLGDELVE